MSHYKPSVHLPGATEIPRATSTIDGSIPLDSDADGRSSGFDHNKPGRVVVDPDEPDSIEIDFSKIPKDTLQKTARAKPGMQFFQALASQEKPKAKKTRTPKPMKAVKSAAEDLIVDDYEDVLMTAEKEKPEFGGDTRDYLQAIADAFAGLGIPFLSSAVPSKPCFTVYFEFDQFGTLSAKYHQVIDANECLVLVYDTRFEYGQQYLPPSLGTDKAIRIGIPETGANYSVASLGLNWTMGCLDFVLLVKV